MNRMAPLVAILAFLAGTADAAQPGDMLACPGLKDAAARLQCYDEAFPAVRPLLEGNSPIASFGAPALPKAPEPEDKPAEPDEIVAIVAAMGEAGIPGRSRIELDNGQVWLQAESGGLPRKLVGKQVRIVRTFLGTYLLAPVEGGRRVRFERVR